MQLNKVFRALLLVFPILVLVACSTKRGENNNPDRAEGSASIANSSNDLSVSEQARFQVQKLQKENIVYFNLDKYDISDDFIDVLVAHATFLRNNASYKVTIEGHADEHGTPEYNIALGERRANSVKMYLQGQGVLADQISIISYGEEKPAILGHNEMAYSKNRRAVLVY